VLRCYAKHRNRIEKILCVLRVRETFIKQEILNVLFLCTGNSARSILAEVILNSLGKNKFKAFSAGSQPVGSVNPLALALLEKNRLSTEGLRSKDWSEFSRPGAPFMHFVFTVCDQAAAEPCPVWPGQPMTAHWGVHDPAAVQGSDADKRKAFLKAYTELYRRISLFTNLPFDTLNKLALKEKLDEIGRTQ
jgi:protein-tyrosine-phosphatase